MLEFQFSPSLRILREPALAPFPVLPPTAVCVPRVAVRGGWVWESGVRGVWKNVWTAPETGKLSLPLPEGCVFLSNSPSPFGFQQ